ncbi:MAG: isopentenyl phosphate kinase [Candidatus Undinarchaeales archaeon]|jgi:isopentenyl phosphate kinase|nr:isopentenyl phosphate kinase [Candidatus Undinarchaeales archaeon]
MAELIFVKLGGSAITEKTRENTLNPIILEQAANELSECEHKLLIGHGGGSFAHPVAEKYNVQEGMITQGTNGFNKTRENVMKLGSLVLNALKTAGMPAVYVPSFACTLMKNGKVNEIFTSPIERYLSLGEVPVLPGDVCLDSKIGCSIASTEMLFKFLAEKLKPSRIIIGTNVDGVLDKKNNVIPEVTEKNLDKILENVEETETIDVTGGMRHKVEELMATGIETQIINLKTPTLLQRAIDGEIVGTVIK